MASKKSATRDSGLPEGFEPLTPERVAGWFNLEEGNTIVGTYRGHFVTRGKFGEKKVHRVEVSRGETSITTPEGETEMVGIGVLVGLDERGYLKSLERVEEGRQVYVEYIGLEPPSKENPRGVHRFKVGAVPF